MAYNLGNKKQKINIYHFKFTQKIYADLSVFTTVFTDNRQSYPFTLWCGKVIL